STPTATRMNTPMNSAVSSLGHPSRVTAALTVPTSRAPRMVPSTVPRPPRMLVPPMTTAAITCSSKPVPTAWPMRPPPATGTPAASPAARAEPAAAADVDHRGQPDQQPGDDVDRHQPSGHPHPLEPGGVG